MSSSAVLRGMCTEMSFSLSPVLSLLSTASSESYEPSAMLLNRRPKRVFDEIVVKPVFIRESLPMGTGGVLRSRTLASRIIVPE